MKKHFFSFAAMLVLACAATPALAGFECDDMGDWLGGACRHLSKTYRDGDNELLLSGFAWHLPMTYTKEKRQKLNERAYGIGWGRTLEDSNGDTSGLVAMAFLDSHKCVEWNVGYTWSTFWGARDSLQLGLGYAAMIVQRPDIASGVPVPVALPLLTFRYQNASLVTTFIPTIGGGVNNGSVLYIFGRYTLK